MVQTLGTTLPFAGMFSPDHTTAFELPSAESGEQEDALEKISEKEIFDNFIWTENNWHFHLADRLFGNAPPVHFPFDIFQEIQSPPPDLTYLG